MEKRIYRVEPILEERTWGGQKIREAFQYQTDLKNVAQVYHVIAIPGHLDNRLDTGELLSSFYKTHPHLFLCHAPEMPVRLVTACAKTKLSIHLHPDDTYALAHEGMRGKVEGGVSIEARDEYYIARVGHTAQTREEFERLVKEKNFDKLLNKVVYKVGDYHHIPYGFLHGGGSDEITEETIDVAWSTNGDVTYRLYDWDRNDPERPLHVQQVMDNIKIPDLLPEYKQPVPYEKDGCILYDYFSVPGEYVARRAKVTEKGHLSSEQFMFILCGKGSGSIQGLSIKAGETIFVPAQFGSLALEGNMDLFILSYID